jgi:hypothetical protein
MLFSHNPLFDTMRRLSTFLLSSVLAFGLLFAVGCDSSGSTADGESGSLELRMDGSTSKALSTVSAKASAADSVTEAVVTIDEVSIVPSEDSTDGDSTEVGVQALTNENFEVDLKKLQAGLDTALAEFEIPAGKYSQIRLITAEPVQATFKNGDPREVMIASGQQTGLKVNFPEDEFTIENADDRVEVTLNWNVDKFAEDILKGNTQNDRGKLVITPVIDATVNIISGDNDVEGEN